MSKLLQVRLDKSRQEKLASLYKLFQIEIKDNAERFRELLDKLYSKEVEQSNTPTLSTTHTSELEELEGWDCEQRVLIYPYNKFSKKKEPMIACLNPTMNPTMRDILSNKIYIQICKKCHDTGGSTKSLALPEPKKPEKPQPTSKPQSVQKERKCVDCGCDISHLEDWKTLCLSCWQRKQNPAWQGEGKPLAGSPMALRMKEAEAIRRANAKLIKQPKEE